MLGHRQLFLGIAEGRFLAEKMLQRHPETCDQPFTKHAFPSASSQPSIQVNANAGAHHIEDRQRQENLPTERQHLIDAGAGKSPAKPHEYEHHDQHLDPKPQDARQKRPLPATQKKGRRQDGHSSLDRKSVV